MRVYDNRTNKVKENRVKVSIGDVVVVEDYREKKSYWIACSLVNKVFLINADDLKDTGFTMIKEIQDTGYVDLEKDYRGYRVIEVIDRVDVSIILN